MTWRAAGRRGGGDGGDNWRHGRRRERVEQGLEGVVQKMGRETNEAKCVDSEIQLAKLRGGGDGVLL